ncbi:MAG TPA: hypothetical protein VM451_07180 [Candidatus Limnocylindria bacterium]|nr:hypothetical protein [Candidatus Limnocylindria bacterium]
MRLAPVAAAVAMILSGCGVVDPGVAVHQDLNNNTHCAPEKFLVGQLTERLALQSEEEGLRGLIWPSSYKFRWSPGLVTGHYAVLDENGGVVAVTGARYKIGGLEFVAAGNAFWVCGGLTPQ